MIDFDQINLAHKNGLRMDIKNGELVIAEDGFLEISTTIKPFCVLIDKMRKTFHLMVPASDYRGRHYKLRKADCVTIVLEWYEREKGYAGLVEQYLNVDHRTFLEAYKAGQNQLTTQFGFIEVDNQDAQPGDALVMFNHVGVLLEDGSMLHHLPSKLSCVDAVNWSLVTGVFRYADQNATH